MAASLLAVEPDEVRAAVFAAGVYDFAKAYLLRSRLTELKKEFEIHLFPDRAHNLGREAFAYELDFFKRRL